MILTSEEWEIVRLSLEVAFLASLLCLPFAIATAWLLARTQFFGKSIINAIVHAPLVLPPVVVGYLLLLLLGTRGLIGHWLLANFDIRFVFTTKGAVLATAVMAFPLVVRGVLLSLTAIDEGLELAGRTLGASQWDAFCSITLPLILPGILSGSVVGFARALGEFGATITFASNIEGQTRTLPLALYTATQSANGDASAVRLVIISMTLALVALGLSDWFERTLRRMLGFGGPT
ncbi:MAG: molybdate ABC transporter permease subunit [Burkholderiaceae bacterium]|jgi:molybdate transport system permease protein